MKKDEIDIQKILYSKLWPGKISYSMRNHGAHLIHKDEFLSYLAIPMIEATKDGEYVTYENREHEVRATFIDTNTCGSYYLNCFQVGAVYGPTTGRYVRHNNATPLTISSLMTEDGVKKFLDIYREDIEACIQEIEGDLSELKLKVENKEYQLSSIRSEIEKLNNGYSWI